MPTGVYISDNIFLKVVSTLIFFIIVFSEVDVVPNVKKKAPEITGARYVYNIAIALRAPNGVCMPPPCFILNLFYHVLQIWGIILKFPNYSLNNSLGCREVSTKRVPLHSHT